MRRVSSPKNFERFNDPVIQSASLRSARPVELDYSSSQDYGIMMPELLRFVFTNHAASLGEAARDFALALALGGMRLSAIDWQVLKGLRLTLRGDPVAAAFFEEALERGAG